MYIKYISFIDDVLDVKKDLQSQRPCRIVRGRERRKTTGKCRKIDERVCKIYVRVCMCMYGENAWRVVCVRVRVSWMRTK